MLPHHRPRNKRRCSGCGAIEPAFAAGLHAMLCGAARLPRLSITPTPPTGPRNRAPSCPATLQPRRQERTWAPILGVDRARSLPAYCIPNGDPRRTRRPSSTGSCSAPHSPPLRLPWAWRARPGWQAAAQVRLLFSSGCRLAPGRVYSEALWTDPDVAGSPGRQPGPPASPFFNREQFDELLTWPPASRTHPDRPRRIHSAEISPIPPASQQSSPPSPPPRRPRNTLATT